jgi:site-specific recombinase XerD
VGEVGRQTAQARIDHKKGEVAVAKKARGIYEKVAGSGIWWIRYANHTGRIRREKAGTRSAATRLYQKRKTQVLQGEKLPENFRARPALFSELAQSALGWSKAHKISYGDDVIRMKPLVEQFGARTGESITSQDIEKWFAEKTWKPATFNRYKALISLVFRLGTEAGRVKTNPARSVKTRTENNARVRYLSNAEEEKLRQRIADRYPARIPEFDIALHTGMRRSEQYGLTWECVDLDKRILTIPRSKHGGTRYVFLNDTAVAAMQVMWRFGSGTGRVFSNGYTSASSCGARHWFENCVKDAKLENFTWHCLRHTFASNLVMRGVDIRTVQELLGHKVIQMTLRYAHLAPQHQLAAVQRLCDTVVLPQSTVTEQKCATGTRASTDGSEARNGQANRTQ